MREILTRVGLEISELSRRFKVSRPTVYKYIDNYGSGYSNDIPDKIKLFFDFLSEPSNQNKECVTRYLLDNFNTEDEIENIEDDRIIESIISKFCDKKQTSDNFLSLVLPTGSRKTSSVVRFIAKSIAEGETRKFFFITTLKKNLPVNADRPAEDMLRSAFNEYGIGSLYDERVLVVNSLADMLLENYPRLAPIERQNCARVVGDKTISELNNHISTLKEIKEHTYAYANAFDDFRRFESTFRKKISRAIANPEMGSKDPDVRKRLVTEDRRWSWISKLYPTVFTQDRQVFLMSVAKFISTHDTIIDGRYSVFNSKLIDDSMIFIDEFDATKETVLNRIIETDKDHVDYIGIFRRIFRTLEHNRDIWKEYYRTPADMNSKSANRLGREIESIIKTCDALVSQYHLECDFKLADSEPTTYIFRDNRLIKTGKNTDFVVKYDKEQRINIIYATDPSTDNPGSFDLTSMLGQMYALFRHFESILYILALNHCRIQEEKGKPISLDSAIRTMLDPYDFNEDQIEYLLNAIKFRPPRRADSKDLTPDISFYEYGFEFFNIVDNDAHNLSTKLYCTSIKRTPEKMLMMTLARSHKARVIGISATARLRTVVGNYDFRYLKSQEDFSEYRISESDRNGLHRMFSRTIDSYSRINIQTELIGSDVPKDLIRDPALAADLRDILDSLEKDYVRERYARVFTAYHKFLEAEDARSMLCFLNIFPRNKSAQNLEDFSEELLKKIFSIMVEEYCTKLQSDGKAVPPYIETMKSEPFFIISSNDYDRKKELLLNKLSKGEKVFVITTYATVGAGQNLQYHIPAEVISNIRSVRSTAKITRNDSKDFDAVYLDMPTNIVTSVKENDIVSLLKALFEIESLQENHEIDIINAKSEIERSFSGYYGASQPRRSSAMEQPSYRMAYARKIIQAIGRICRTSFKNSNIYIFADDHLGKVFKNTSIRDFVDPAEMDADLEEIMANPEFRALHAELQNSSFDSSGKNVKALIDNESVKTMEYINTMLRNTVWSPNAMNSWKAVREFVLSFPTAPADSKFKLVYNMYHRFENPAKMLKYSMEGDYRKVYIDPEGPYLISEEDARLPDFIKIPAVAPLFGDPAVWDYDNEVSLTDVPNGKYASRFVPNTAIMCPALYHNIYKGALGEISGKAILSSWNIPIQDITDPEQFEKFDYITENGIYLDFKHWSSSGNIDNTELIKKSFIKLKTIKGHKALIINILKPKEYSGSDQGYTIKGCEEGFTLNGAVISVKDRSENVIDLSDLTIITIPYLFDCEGNTAIENPFSKEKIIQEVSE